MKLGWFVLVAILGCQSGPEDSGRTDQEVAAPLPRAAGPYASDIEKLCNVVVRSGADTIPGPDRHYPIATWLAANLTTPESRKFLVKIQPMVGEAKAVALETEAHRVGLAGCPLANEWRTPPSP